MAPGFVRLPTKIRRTQSAPSSNSMRNINGSSLLPRRRRSNSGIMKITTLDESLHRAYKRESEEGSQSSLVNKDEEFAENGGVEEAGDDKTADKAQGAIAKSEGTPDVVEAKGDEKTDKAESTKDKNEGGEGPAEDGGVRNTGSTVDTAESTTTAEDKTKKKTAKAKKKLAQEKIQKALDERRKIFFKELEIREYPRLLGDNPSCFGPPLTIGWDYNTYKVTVDEYEENRPKRRNQSEMLIPKKARFDMLMKEWGYSRLQIASVIRANVKTRHRRARSYALFGGPLYRAEIVFQSASRKIKRRISGTKSTRQQYEEWKLQMAQEEDFDDLESDYGTEGSRQEKHPNADKTASAQSGEETGNDIPDRDEEKEVDLEEVERQLRQEMEENEDEERAVVEKTRI